MKLRFIIILFIGLFINLIPNKVNASHFAGADLTYTCLGGNTYLITLSFYRDCSGIGVGGSAPLVFSCNSNTALSFNATLNQIPGTGIEITPGCNAMPTSCTSGSTYGIREYIFQGQVTLPPCASWNISYASGARNPITTVSGTGSWYIPAQLNNLNAPCNSSPVFSNRPIAVVCNGQSFCFNHGAIDPDGDSLSYSFYTPMTSASSTITYIGGYSSSNFLGLTTPISLNPVTGDICFIPNTILSTATGIKVQEWRKINGVPTVIGTVFRDIQLVVTSCVNSIPVLSGMDTLLTHSYNPNDSIFYLEKCLSPFPIVFHINGYDADSFNSANTGHPERFSITWNNGIPGASFNSFYNGTDSAYAVFTWLPNKNDVSFTPKCFTATIRDEACQYNGLQTFSYCLVIRGMDVELGPDSILLCQGETYTVNAVADTSTENYIWRMDGVSTGTPLTQSSYIIYSDSLSPGLHILSIETNDGGTTTKCPGVDFLKVRVVAQPEINGTLLDSAFCYPGSITYDAGPGQVYTWTKVSAGGIPVGATQQFSTSSSGVYRIEVDGGNNTRCKDVDTFNVMSIMSPNLPSDTCMWGPANYTLDAGYTDPGNQYLWSTGANSKEIVVTESGHYSVSISNANISPSVKCADEQTVNIMDLNTFIMSIPFMATEDNPIPGEELRAGDQEICAYQRLRIIGPEAPVGHSYDYSWYQNGNLVSQNDFYFFKETVAGEFEIKLQSGGCEDKIVVTTEICDVEVPNVITPNGDGKNDRFVIVIKGTGREFYESFPNSTLIIYNRWGKKIFESSNYQNNWTGEGMADGVYFYNLYLADGKDTYVNGTVTILSK